MRASVDPLVFGRLVRSIRRARPDVVHTHLVHADFHGLPAARLARVPLLVSTKHGFNPFRSRRTFAAADRTVARLADVHVAISAGLARYLAENEGFDASAFEVVHYGIEPGPEPPSPPGEPRLAIVGRLIPIKGHEVLLEALRLARDEVPELTLEIAGDGPLDVAAPCNGDAARSRGSGHVPRQGRPARAGLRARRDRRRAVVRRGLRHGRARGDGARPRRDRERRRGPAGDRRERARRASSCRRAIPLRWRGRSSSSPATRSAPQPSARPDGSARSPRSRRSAAPSGRRRST